MNPEKQRIAIAEWCGWKFEDRPCRGMQASLRYWTGPDGRDYGIHPLIPDYPNDLNAMWEAEATVFNKKDWSRYTDILCDQVQSKAESPIRATAAQRAEALLRTIGKWEA